MEKITTLQRDKAIREEAREWVIVFNRDEPPSPEQIRGMQAWVSRSPVHAAELERAEARWEDTSQLRELAVPLCPRCNDSSSGETTGWWGRWFDKGTLSLGGWGAMASLLAVSVVLFSLYSAPAAIGNGVYGTAVGELRLLTLEDGSQIQLDTDSQAEIYFDDAVRRIYLRQGKAHFDVAKNADRPFEVYAADGLVRAVGTAFSVYLKQSNHVEVLVDEGKVDLVRVDRAAVRPAIGSTASASVAESKPLNGKKDWLVGSAVNAFGSLERGEAALFNRLEEQFTVLAERELEQQQSWRKGVLIFAGEPLGQVVSEIGRYTSAKIEIKDFSLGELQVGGRFNIGDIDALFNVLESAFDVRVVIVAENHYQLHRVSP